MAGMGKKGTCGSPHVQPVRKSGRPAAPSAPAGHQPKGIRPNPTSGKNNTPR